MKRCATDLRLSGFEIGSHINELGLDAPALEPVFKAAEDLGLGLFVHPWDMGYKGRLSDYWMPWLVGMPAETTSAICATLMGGVLNRHPRLKICFAHGGGAYPYLQGRISHGHKVRPDLCAHNCTTEPAAFNGKFFTDSLVHDTHSLDLLLTVMGEDNVVLGSDYPFPLGELDPPGKVIHENHRLNEDTKRKLLSENGLRFLGLEKFKFQ